MIVSRTIRLNPLSITSAVLFLTAPFLSWMTVSAFGFTAESNLIDVTHSNTPLQIPQNLPLISLTATILLISGGILLLKNTKIGLPLATAGVAIFLVGSYQLYGSPASIIPVAIVPGIGLLTALVSVGIGTVSLRVHGQVLNDYLQKIKTRQGLTAIGLFVATVSLTIDGLNHTVEGQISGFIGTGIVEPIFHLGFAVSLFLLVVIFDVRRKWVSASVNSVVVATAFSFILLDVAYHLSTGEVSGFLGHEAQEMLLHISTYYGSAFLLIGRLLKR